MLGAATRCIRVHLITFKWGRSSSAAGVASDNFLSLNLTGFNNAAICQNRHPSSRRLRTGCMDVDVLHPHGQDVGHFSQPCVSHCNTNASYVRSFGAVNVDGGLGLRLSDPLSAYRRHGSCTAPQAAIGSWNIASIRAMTRTVKC